VALPPPPPAANSGTPRCLDGNDNDNDGFIDFPADPGCGSPIDEDEAGSGIVVGSSNETLRMLTPFPVVRLAGRIQGDGVRITLLTVWGPVGSKITISCRGTTRSCPRAKTTIRATAQLTRFRAFQRRMRAGTVLRIYITRPGTVGKYTRFTIRRQSSPLRRDGCALPNSTPITCRVSS
jgi:hypothetical protein